jgi:hypothetical protein
VPGGVALELEIAIPQRSWVWPRPGKVQKFKVQSFNDRRWEPASASQPNEKPPLGLVSGGFFVVV